MRRFCINFCFIAVLLILGAGCNSLSGAQEKVLSAVAKTSEVQSYRSSGNTTSCTDEGCTTSSYEEEIASPDYFHLKMTFDNDQDEYIKAGDKLYIRHEDGEWQDVHYEEEGECLHYENKECQEWQKRTGGVCSASICIFEDMSFTQLPHMIVDEISQEDNIDGVECSYYKGRIDTASFAKEAESKMANMTLTGNVTPAANMTEYLENILQSEIDVELWIDRDGYIRQVKTEGRIPYTEPGTGDRKWATYLHTTKYSDFNEEIPIAPPPDI